MNDNRSGQEQWAAMLPRLAELATENLSSRQIAVKLSEEFGFAVTRGAVMGKLHREGFRPNGVNGPGPPRGSQRTSLRKVVMPAGYSSSTTETRGRGVHIMDLRPHHCRWIEGPAASMLYCGEPTTLGLSWCPTHERIVYGKSSIRS